MVLNLVKTVKFDIQKVLAELAKTNPLFCSELEFQFYLAWKIKELYADEYKICIEYPMKSFEGKNRNIDLLLIDSNNAYIPIELKYKPRKFSQVIGGFEYNLKEQGANDLARYGHLNDISRIEYFKKVEKSFKCGYAITITNYERLWQGILNPQQTDYEFSLEDGIKICSGIKSWHKRKSNYNETENPPVILENDYHLKWFDYCNFDRPNGLFRVLVTEVK